MNASSPYRYVLTRSSDVLRIQTAPRRVLVVMLNPSTADEHQDDPTIRRLCAFMRLEGWEQLRVVNLFAWRATDPEELARRCRTDDVVGPENDEQILHELALADMAIAAWGTQGGTLGKLVRLRAQQVQVLLNVENHRRSAMCVPVLAWQCLGTTTNGAPRHPLYVKGATPARPWDPAGWRP